MGKLVAKQSIEINAPISKVWDALVNPRIIKEYMFGTDAVSDWKKGSPLIFRGEWQGKKYEDKGIILAIEKEKTLKYTYFSSMSGLPDKPENYAVITLEVSHAKSYVVLSLSQDNIVTEQAREHSEKNWKMVLETIKTIIEK